MRPLLLIISLVGIIVSSCKKNTYNTIIPDGNYVGTFQRLSATGGQLSNVTLTFSENSWTGQSEFSKYPALCHGTYRSIEGNKVTFENACIWTTEFDWTLILSGDFELSITGTEVELVKEYNGGYKDIYRLKKQ